MTNPNDPAYAANLTEWVIPGTLLDKYPELAKDLQTVVMSYRGLTKREYFAAMAMQGILANNRLITSVEETGGDEFGLWEASKALQAADALITELNKEKP